MTRTDILNGIATYIDADSYLEIGVRNKSHNFNRIKVKHKISVDPARHTRAEYIMDSDTFFRRYKGRKFDLVFVDGMHTSEQVYKDVINSLKFLNSGGIIVLHDCNPPTKYHTRSYEQYLANRGEWNGDVYRAFIRLRKELSEANHCFTVDTDFGCGVIAPKGLFDPSVFPEVSDGFDVPMSDISYQDFNSDRERALGLIKPHAFNKIIS